MHPFSMKTLYAILLALVSYLICYYAFISMHGFIAIVLRTLLFIALFGGTIIYFDLSPDVLPVLGNLRNKVFGKKNNL